MTESELHAVYQAIPETGISYADLAILINPTLLIKQRRAYGETLASKLDSNGLLTCEGSDGLVYQFKTVDKMVYRFIRFGEDPLDTDRLRWPGRKRKQGNGEVRQ